MQGSIKQQKSFTTIAAANAEVIASYILVIIHVGVMDGSSSL